VAGSATASDSSSPVDTPAKASRFSYATLAVVGLVVAGGTAALGTAIWPGEPAARQTDEPAAVTAEHVEALPPAPDPSANSETPASNPSGAAPVEAKAGGERGPEVRDSSTDDGASAATSASASAPPESRASASASAEAAPPVRRPVARPPVVRRRPPPPSEPGFAPNPY
jgi:hypothetical protein